MSLRARPSGRALSTSRPGRGKRITTGQLGVLCVCALAALVSCRDDSAEPSLAAALCPTIRAWSDQTADVGDQFRFRSREASTASARRTAYAEAFDDLRDVHGELVARLDGIAELADGGPSVATRLSAAARDALAVFDDGAGHAAALPDDAYEVRAVREGKLYTSIEKARAIVFQELDELADDPEIRLSPDCGRRAPLDLSPSATFPQV